jgi:hypothetical protein
LFAPDPSLHGRALPITAGAAFALPRAYGAAAFPLPCLAGNPSGEEVRDGSHDSNRGRGNRGGISPTALRLLRVGAGTTGPCTTLEAALDSHPARPSLCPRNGHLAGRRLIMWQMHGPCTQYIVAPEVGADSPHMGSRSALLTTGRAFPSSRRGLRLAWACRWCDYGRPRWAGTTTGKTLVHLLCSAPPVSRRVGAPSPLGSDPSLSAGPMP